MSSKRTEPRAIASQLVSHFAGAAVVLLLCALGVLYWIVVRHSYEEDDAVLADKMQTLRTEVEKTGGTDTLGPIVSAAGPLESGGFLIRLLDGAGRQIAESAGMKTLPADLFPSAAGSHPVEARVSGRLYALSSVKVRADGQAITLQVAQDRTADDQFAQEFGLLALAVLVVGSVAAAVIARAVAARGLKPLGEMAVAVQQISSTRLHQRIATEPWPRELQPVAGAFDEMLGRLEESFTRLSQFSADLAHELRTPVGNIRGEAEVALGRARSSEEYRAVLESTVAEAERLSSMIDNLLFLARAEAADRKIQAVDFDACREIEKIAAYHRTLADDRQVQIACRGEGVVHADRLLFGRAVSNLVDNALRFVRPGGQIDVALSTDQTSTTIVVSDDGSGIAKEDLPHVFDRLYRGDKSRSSSGTGLGLAIVKSIMELHGGTVAIASEEAQGTRVTLTFPRHGA